MRFCGQILGNYRNKKLQEFANIQQPLLFSLLYFMIFNLSLALAGALLTVYLEPAAASDGIAEIKGVLLPNRIQCVRTDVVRVHAAYLNGIHVQRFFNLRTILVKIVGTICSVSSGFASGPEGPMIHIGAGIASGVTRGDKVKNLCFEFSPAVLGKFHNDR
jgi:chloride channel 7